MAPIKILIINPNSSQSMTDGLHEPIESLDYNNTTYTYHTSPSGPKSINSPADAALSTTHTLPSLLPLLASHDAFLVACYSLHPLVDALKKHLSASTHDATNTPTQNPKSKPVIGIFEASIHAAVQLLHPDEKFGIVSTGDIWKPALEQAVREDVLGRDLSEKVFKGVECCAMAAGDLHGGEGEEEVRGRVKRAVGRLCGGDGGGGKDGGGDGENKGGKVGVVILGCAGMVGMERWVREVVGEGVRVVDGVKAGVGVLQGLVRGGF